MPEQPKFGEKKPGTTKFVQNMIRNNNEKKSGQAVPDYQKGENKPGKK